MSGINPVAIALIVGGGILGGLFTTPMKWMPSWEWENQWAVYSVFGMLVWPWALVFSTVPDVWQIYADSDTDDILLTALFGAGWGLGSTLFGIGTAAVGNSLGFSIILGLTATLGSVIVMVALHRDALLTPVGVYNLVGLAITVLGLAGCGYAGMRKEREQAAAEASQRLLKIEEPQEEGGGGPQLGFCAGMVICLLSGALSPMLNLALAFGNDGTAVPGGGMQEQATHEMQMHGVTHTAQIRYSNNPTWCIGVGAGFFVNIGYCCYKLTANGSWGNFLPDSCLRSRTGAASLQDHGPRDRAWSAYALAPWYYASPHGAMNWIYTIIMGLLWYGGNVMYGIGSNMLGDLGDAVGWPVFIVCMVMTGNISG